MRIVRVLAALALYDGARGLRTSGKPELAGLNLGQDTLAPAAWTGETTSSPSAAASEITGSTPALPAPACGREGRDARQRPGDDLLLGKRHYREKNYGLAEQHFRRAAERLPRDGEAWLGLAASYDRLKRYDLADRAYSQALADLRTAAGSHQQHRLLVPPALRPAPCAAEVRRGAGQGSRGTRRSRTISR